MTTPSREPSAASAIVAPPMGHHQAASVGDQLRRDREASKRNTGAGEWRQTLNDLKRLFGQ